MKFFAMQKYPYRARYYEFTLGGPALDTKEYTFARDITFAGGDMPSDIQRGSLSIMTKEILTPFARIDTVLDRNGNLISDNGDSMGAVYELRNFSPVLNAFGVSEGFIWSAIKVALT